MFLMLPMLLGLGAVAIPVVIHLLHRQRMTPVRWGAMQFLIESELQAKRRRLVEHWLLLLARMAVLALLVFALARPLLHADLATPLGGGTSTDFAVVLDHSLSMGRAAGDGKTAFARGVDLADQIAGSLRPADSLAVVLAEHMPRPLTDRPVNGAELSKVRDSLQQLTLGSTDANLAEAVQAARDVVRRGRGVHKKLIVISDEQRTGWQIDNATAWKAALGDATGGVDSNMQVFDVAVPTDANAANVSVATPAIQPGVVGPGDRVEITAAVSRSESGELQGAVPVHLTVDGQPIASQTLADLAPGSTRTIRFEHAFTTPGSHWLRVDADVRDALAADNAATLAINVPEKLPVLIVDGQLTAAGSFRASQFLAAAMQPSDAGPTGILRPAIVSASDAGAQRFTDYAAVVVNDVPALPPDVLAKLDDYARGGHGVWFILGPHTRPSFVNGDFARSGLMPIELAADKPAQAEGGATGVTVKDPTNRAVALLAGGDKSPLAGVVTTQWWPIKPASADVRTVVTTSRGEPLVVEFPVGTEGGRTILWTTSADGRWNTLPLTGAFVPLVNETVQHLAGPSVQATWGRTLQPRQPIVWTGPLTPPVMAAAVTPPAGESTPLKVSTEAGRAVARFDGTFTPGVYEMRFTPSAVPQPIYFSVAPDPRELDPATLTAADVRWLKDNRFLQARVEPAEVSALTATAGAGAELWPTLAVAVVGMLVVETFMTRRMVRLQAGAAKLA